MSWSDIALAPNMAGTHSYLAAIEHGENDFFDDDQAETSSPELQLETVAERTSE